MRFLEEVNAYLEQLNAAKCHKDPFLVAFTLTTDATAQRHDTTTPKHPQHQQNAECRM